MGKGSGSCARPSMRLGGGLADEHRRSTSEWASNGEVRTALSALLDYQFSGYRALNAWLRAGADPRGPSRAAELDEALLAGFSSAPTLEGLVLYRGLSMSADSLPDVWHQPAYLSTTSDRRIAERFALDGTLLRIHLPDPVPALSFGGLADSGIDDAEAEILLPRDCTLLVEGARAVSKGSSTVVDAILVPPTSVVRA